jgi:hypothetical protein
LLGIADASSVAQKEKILTTYIYMLELINTSIEKTDQKDKIMRPAQSLFQQALSRLENPG